MIVVVVWQDPPAAAAAAAGTHCELGFAKATGHRQGANKLCVLRGLNASERVIRLCCLWFGRVRAGKSGDVWLHSRLGVEGPELSHYAVAGPL